MFTKFTRWIYGIPPDNSEARFLAKHRRFWRSFYFREPAKPPQQRENEYFREDELHGNVDEMISAGVLEVWRTDSSGRAWYTSSRDTLDWWKKIQP